MGGTFKINKGVLKTSDFVLSNEALSLTGTGKIDIGRQRIDMRLVPGQRQDNGGTRVAMKVKGKWNDIKYVPDFETALKDKLKEALTDSSDDDEPSDAEIVIDLLGSIFGGR